MQQSIDLLADVKSHFNHWRATRTKRGKIPDYLWDKVRLLVGKYSLKNITETLSLSTSQIRDHVNNHNTGVNFVEVCTNPITQIPLSSRHQNITASDNKTCSLEFHKSNGCMLKISDYPIESLSMIITHFIG